MPHRSAAAWRGLGGKSALLRSRPAPLQIYNPLKRRRAYWPALSKPELRLLMHGLAEWEERSRGPVKARIRRKRVDAVSFYRKRFGGLSSDRYWVGQRMHRKIQHEGLHNPKREKDRGVLWHEA
jgi:hypothetical protein